MKIVLCPLKPELKYIVAHFQKLGFQAESIKINKHIGFVFPELKVIFAEGGHGKVQFGITTQKLISQFEDVESVICAGSAGGLCSSLSVLDIVIGAETVEHDYKERFNARAKPPVISGSEKMIFALSSFSSSNFKVHLGRIASGDEDIVDIHRAMELSNNVAAIAVAWEGIGGAKACRFNNIPYLEIRALTDNAQSDAAGDFGKNLPLAMGNLAQLLTHYVIAGNLALT